MSKAIVFVWATVVCAGLSVGAQTNNWAGARSGGNWDVPANWSPEGVPDGQDVVANVVVAWSDTATVTLGTSVRLGGLHFNRSSDTTQFRIVSLQRNDDETIDADVSSGRFVLSAGYGMSGGVRWYVPLVGSADVEIWSRNRGGLSLYRASTYSGDTYIVYHEGTSPLGTRAVRIHLGSVEGGGEIVSGPFGTGTVHLEDRAGIQVHDSATTVLHNPVVLRGVGVFRVQNVQWYARHLELRGEVALEQHATLRWGEGGHSNTSMSSLDIHGDIVESGSSRNLTLDVRRWSIRVYGSLEHTGATTVQQGVVELHGDNQAATGNFIVKPGGLARLENTAAVSSASTVLLERDGGNFGRLQLNADVTVAGLHLDGDAQPNGEYTSATHPDYLTGNKTLTVDVSAPQGTVIRFR